MGHTQNGPGPHEEPRPNRFSYGNCTRCGRRHGLVPDVINVERGWLAVPESNKARFCGIPLWFVRKSSATAWDFPRLCGAWICRECANRKAEKLLGRATCMFYGCENIFYAVLQSDDQEADRLRERRGRKGGGQLKIPRGDEVHWFSSVLLGGRKSPADADWRPLSPTDALGILAEAALLLPGPYKPRFLGKWEPEKPKKRKQKPMNYPLGPVGKRIWNEAAELVVERISATHHLEPDSWSLRTGPPNGISAEEVTDAINEAIREVREHRRN